MRRSRWVALVFLMLLYAGKTASNSPATNADARQLQGTWTILSVQRNGSAEPTHVGAALAFAEDTVSFQWRGHRRDPLGVDVGPLLHAVTRRMPS